jgi:hypothetical protein
LALLVLLTAVLTACGGGDKTLAAPQNLQMIVTVVPDGGADVRIRVPGDGWSDVALQDLSTQLVRAAFRRTPPVSARAGDGYSLARVHVDGVFRTGPHPVFRFDGNGLRAVAEAHNLPDMQLRLESPSVPASMTTDPDGHRSGDIIDWVPVSAHPWAEVRLNPRPGPWLTQMILALVCFGALAAVWFVRDRPRVAAGLAVLAAATGGAAGALIAAVRADDAGVTGLIGRNALLPCALVPPLAFVAAVAGLVTATRIIRRRSARP